jgi:hypothetical protein
MYGYPTQTVRAVDSSKWYANFFGKVLQSGFWRIRDDSIVRLVLYPEIWCEKTEAGSFYANWLIPFISIALELTMMQFSFGLSCLISRHLARLRITKVDFDFKYL